MTAVLVHTPKWRLQDDGGAVACCSCDHALVAVYDEGGIAAAEEAMLAHANSGNHFLKHGCFGQLQTQDGVTATAFCNCGFSQSGPVVEMAGSIALHVQDAERRSPRRADLGFQLPDLRYQASPPFAAPPPGGGLLQGMSHAQAAESAKHMQVSDFAVSVTAASQEMRDKLQSMASQLGKMGPQVTVVNGNTPNKIGYLELGDGNTIEIGPGILSVSDGTDGRKAGVYMDRRTDPGSEVYGENW